MSETGELIAALFYAGRGAALSHRTAAWWWDLTPTKGDTIHVSVPRRREPTDGLRLHHPRNLVVMRHKRLAVTPPALTLLSFATDASDRELRKSIAEADYRRRTTIVELERVRGRGIPGSATLGAALARHLPELARTASPLENDFLFFCEEHDLPQPLINRRIAGKKVDAYWPEHRVIVELDSVGAHSSAPRRLIDRERDLHLRRLGYTILRYTWHQLHTDPEAVADDLRATLTARC